jgi:phosphoglycerol transferase MdoB-like AlkP superfamily enzyme
MWASTTLRYRFNIRLAVGTLLRLLSLVAALQFLRVVDPFDSFLINAFSAGFLIPTAVFTLLDLFHKTPGPKKYCHHCGEKL